MINPSLLSYFGLNPTGDFGPFTFYTARNKKPVWFLKAPPEKPPTARQRFIRNKLAHFATFWSRLPQATRNNWELASKRARLRMTGYNLFQWFHWHNDRTQIETIERQSGVQLLP